MTDYTPQCKCDEAQCMAGTGCDQCNPQFYMGNLIFAGSVTNCDTPSEFETAMENAIAKAQIKRLAHDMEVDYILIHGEDAIRPDFIKSAEAEIAQHCGQKVGEYEKF